MAYTDNLDQLFGLDKMQAQTEGAKALVKDYLQTVTEASKQIRTMQVSFISPESIQKAKQLSAQAENLTKQQIANIEKLAKARLAEAKAEEAQSRTAVNNLRIKNAAEKEDLAVQKELERQAKVNTKALSDLAKEQQKQEILLKKQSNEYEVLKRQYKTAADEAKRLGAALGVESAQFKAASDSAFKLHTELLKIETAVGQTQRQVGNYNMVGMQFNQLLRELPNAGISARTFIMAISNNITYFAEAVKDARTQGASWGAVLKTVGGSLFSLVGIINIAVTAFTLIALQMSKADDEAKDLEQSTDDLTAAIGRNIAKVQELADLRRETNNQLSESEATLKRQIDLLRAQGATEEEIREAERQFYSTRIANKKDELNSINAVINRTQQLFEFYNKQGLQQEVVQEKVAASLVETIMEVSDVTREEAEKQAAATIKSYVDRNGRIIELERQKLQVTKEINDLTTENSINTINYQKKLNEDLTKTVKTTAQRRSKKERDQLSPLPTVEELKAQIREIENAKIAAELEQALFVNEQGEKRALIALENSFAQGLVSAENYEAEKLRIQNEYAAQRIKLEIETTKLLLNGGNMDESERLKLIARLNELELELAKQGNDKKLEADKKYAAESLKIEQDRANLIKNIRQQLTQTVVQYANFLVERERENLNEKKTRLDEEKEVEIARINATSENEEQAAQRRYVLEQNVLQQKRNIQAREEDIEKKRFLIEQAGALARVLISTQEAAAKIQAQASVLSATPATAPLAAAALAQLPLVYASGAVAAGLIAAQILAYAEGTPDGGHKGGAALVGEAGEPEQVTEPSGKKYWVTKPTLFKNMPKGTEVVPLHKMTADSIDMAQMQSLNMLMLQGGGNNAKTEQLLSQTVDELRSIKNKPTEKTVIKDGSMFKTVIQGNIKYNNLRKNFLD